MTEPRHRDEAALRSTAASTGGNEPPAVVQDHLVSLLAALAEGVAILDPEGVALYVNEVLAAKLEVEVGDVQGHLFTPFVKKNRLDGPGLVRHLASLGDGEHHVVLRALSRRPLLSSVTVTPLEKDGAFSGVLMIVRDAAEQRERSAGLQDIEERFRLTFEKAPIGMVLLDPGGTLFQVNAEMCTILDRPPEDITGRFHGDFLHPDDVNIDLALGIELYEGKRDAYAVEKRMVRPDGSVRDVISKVSIVRTEDGKPQYFIVHLQDVTEQRRNEKQLQQYSELFTDAFRRSPLATAVTDLDGRIVWANPRLLGLLALPEDAGIGDRTVADLVRADDAPAVCELLQSFKGDEHTEGNLDVQLRGAWGMRWMSLSAMAFERGDDGPATLLLQFADITDHKRAEEELVRKTERDILTGVANRELLMSQLTRAKAAAGDHHRPAVLFVDLDGFKAVNDVYGHHMGDELLVNVARALERAVRPTDLVARFGGDEFVLLLTSVANAAEAQSVAERVAASVASCRVEGNEDMRVTASIGVAVETPDIDVGTLLEMADRAMYGAKQRGKNGVVIGSIDPELR